MDEKSLEHVRKLEEAGEFVQALRIYDKYYRENPNDQDAILGIAQIAYLCDNLERAFEFYVRLLIVDHHNPWGYLGRSRILFRLGQVEKAISDISKSIQYDDPPSSIRIDIAATLNEYHYIDEAYNALALIRDDYIQDEDYQAEWIYTLIAKEEIHHSDITMIFQEHDLPVLFDSNDDLYERYHNMLNNTEVDPFYIMCHMIVMKKHGYEIPQSFIDCLLDKSPELQDRVLMLSA